MDDPATSVNRVLEQHRSARAAALLLREARQQIDETLSTYKKESTYSFARLLRASGEMDWGLAPIEKAASDELARQYARPPRLQNSGFIPGFGLRDLVVGTSSSGGYLVASAEELRLGVPGAPGGLLNWCSIVTPGGNRGAQRIGKFTALPTVTVLADESSTAAEQTQTVGQSLLTPSHATTYIEESRQLALQSEGGARAIVQLLSNALRGHVATSLIEGAGTGGEITGLLNDTTVTSTSGATLTMAAVVSTLESVEKSANDAAGLGWAVTASAAKILRQRPVTASGTVPIMADNRIGGYPVSIVAGATATAAFGAWRDMLIFEWAPIEVGINPFGATTALYKQAIIGARGWVAYNAAPLVATSFAVISGIT